MVEGFYNPAHIIRTFIAKEYAFSYFFEDREIRIAHEKGVWTFAKVKKDLESSDWFSWADMASGIFSQNELTKSFAESVIAQNGELIDGTREGEAEVIWKVLEIWAGKGSKVMNIVVRQPGRNARVEEETLEFAFHPAQAEFRP